MAIGEQDYASGMHSGRGDRVPPCADAIEARGHARQLESEIAALRQRVAVLEVFVASIQKMLGPQA